MTEPHEGDYLRPTSSVYPPPYAAKQTGPSAAPAGRDDVHTSIMPCPVTPHADERRPHPGHRAGQPSVPGSASAYEMKTLVTGSSQRTSGSAVS